MADNLKVLGQAALAATTLTNVYTVPASTQAAVSNIVVVNRGATATTFRAAIAVAGAADATKQYLAYDLTLPANDHWQSGPVSLDAADVVRAYAGNANLTCQVFGVQVAATTLGSAVLTGTYASRPAAGTSGRIYLPTDGYSLAADTGAAWLPYGPIMPLTQPPALASWTQTNIGTATVADQRGGVLISTPTPVTSMKMLTLAAPATPYTLTALMIPTMGTSGQYGMCWSNGTAVVSFGVDVSANIPRFTNFKFTNPTTFSASYQTVNMPHMAQPMYMQISDDGTNRICRFSKDGDDYYQIHSIGRTDFLTPTQVGWYAEGGTSATQPAIVLLVSWKQT